MFISMGLKIPTSFILRVLFLKKWKYFYVLSHLHPLQHWWEILDFTFFPAKPDGHGGINTYCRTFCMIINVLIMIIPEDLTVNKNNSVQNMIHKPENPRFTLPWEASFWRGNYVIFGVAGSILLWDCKFLLHLSLVAHFIKS